MHLGPLDPRLTAGIRGTDEREGGEWRAGRRRRRRRRRGSMAGRPELAGDGRPGATDLGFQNRWYREREEGEGNSIPSFAWPGKSPSDPRHGRWRRNPPLSAARSLGSSVLLGKRMGREREGRRSSPVRRTGRGRLGSAGLRVEDRGVPTFFCEQLAATETREKRTRGGGERLGRGHSSKQSRHGEGRERGSGGSAPAVSAPR